MTSTINEFIRFLSSPEENEFQGESANGMHASAYRVKICEDVTGYYACVTAETSTQEPTYQLIAIQSGNHIQFIEGETIRNMFGQEGEKVLKQFSGHSYLNFYDIVYYAQKAIHSKNKSLFKEPLPGAEKRMRNAFWSIQQDVWRFLFDPNFESELESRFINLITALQNPVKDCWGKVYSPISEKYPAWDRWMVQRVLKSIFEPKFLHYNLNNEKIEYINTLRKKFSIWEEKNYCLFRQYVGILDAVKGRQEVTIDFVDGAGRWRAMPVTTQAFSIIEEGEWLKNPTMFMPLSIVAADSEKVEKIMHRLWNVDSVLYPGVTGWLPWCRIIDIRDGDNILWMNQEESVEEPNDGESSLTYFNMNTVNW